MSEASAGETHASKDALDLERLALENRKLRVELERMKPSVWDGVQRLSPLLGGALAVAAFLFGVFQYVEQQGRELAAREHELERQAAARDQEFMKPLWDRELATYFLTSETVATIARTTDAKKRRDAIEQFWQLYTGPLVVFETKELSQAMIMFGDCLTADDACSSTDLVRRGLAVSSAIQVAIQEHSDLRLSEFSKDKFQYGQ
jgi:hypothetical protein